MTKAELRKEAAGLRKALTDAELQQRSLLLLEQFQKLDLSTIRSIHIFLPISEKKEPDTFLIIEWLKQKHPAIKILVPKADFNSLVMTHHVFNGHEDLQKNVFNILEPQHSDLHSGDIDLVVIPLLAFDLKGYRVGYGKGFYDRFLKEISTIKLGLSLFEPVEQISDPDEHDIPLDSCITPSVRYDFTPALNKLIR
jgi:5-formyltetrahydrofolate cyclo-ligase